MSVRNILQLVLLPAVLPIAGCDAAYRYTPITWAEQRQHRWSRDFDGFSLRIATLQGLVGEWWLYPTIEVFGNSESVTVQAVFLQTASGLHPGVIDSRATNIPRGGGVFVVRWDFGKDHPTPKVLGDRATIVLDIILGSQQQVVRIEYNRIT